MVVTANEKYSEMIGKECTLETVLDGDLQTGQHVPLLAILNNLTANAVEAIDEKGQVLITVETDEEWVRFSVCDTGKGIPIEHEDIIFEPGYTTKFTDQGTAATGIGLSHVCAIIEALRGTIVVKRLDQGLNVLVEIPMESIMEEIEA